MAPRATDAIRSAIQAAKAAGGWISSRMIRSGSDFS